MSEESTTTQALTCGTCHHWHRSPTDPENLRAPPQGECREGPPALLPVLGPRGGLTLLAHYPVVGVGFPACSRHSPSGEEIRRRQQWLAKLAESGGGGGPTT